MNTAKKIIDGGYHYSTSPTEVIQRLATMNVDALAIYSFRHSHSGKWRLRKEHILRTTPITDKRFREAMKLLEAMGLARLVAGRKTASGQFIGREWVVNLLPEKVELKAITEAAEKPLGDNTPEAPAVTEDEPAITEAANTPCSGIDRYITNNQLNIININKPCSTSTAVDNSKIAIQIPLKNGRIFNIEKEAVREMQEKHPNILVIEEILQYKEWLSKADHQRSKPKTVAKEIKAWLRENQAKATGK